MFLEITTITTVLLNLFITVPSATAPPEQKNTNDAIVEFFHNCKCVPFYDCEISQYAKLNSSELVKCSDPFYRCCKNLGQNGDPVPINNTTTSTTSPNITTTEKPSSNVVSRNINCGFLKIAIDVRNPDTDYETTISDEQPWIVEIFQKTRNNNDKADYRFKCAGTLIHPRVVLTAMHCFHLFSEQAIKVVAAGTEVFQNIGADPHNEQNIFKIVKHPKYHPLSLYNDLALIILQADTSDIINPICLPENNAVLDGKKCVAVGWGQNSKHSSTSLRKVQVPLVNFQQCQNFLRKTSLGENFILHESFLCAGGEKGKDTCKGDGGGPLICFGDNDRYFQAGIVSWGVGCGVIDQPGVYTNVSYFKDWIVEELKNYNIEIQNYENSRKY